MRTVSSVVTATAHANMVTRPPIVNAARTVAVGANCRSCDRAARLDRRNDIRCFRSLRFNRCRCAPFSIATGLAARCSALLSGRTLLVVLGRGLSAICTCRGGPVSAVDDTEMEEGAEPPKPSFIARLYPSDRPNSNTSWSSLHLAEPLSGRAYSSSVRWAHACLGARMPERCTGNGRSSSLGRHCELPDRSSVRGLNTAPDRTWDEVDLFSAVDWRLLPGVCVPIRLLPRQCARHRKPGASATGSRGAVCCVRMW